MSRPKTTMIGSCRLNRETLRTLPPARSCRHVRGTRPLLCGCLLLWQLSGALLLAFAQQVVQDGCSLGAYYDDFDLASSDMRQALGDLLSTTHRRPLPYTGEGGQDDVWAALVDLDAGSDSDTVRGIYSQSDVAVSLAGETDGWNREHLWPQSRGVGEEASSNPAFTDLHNLRPSEWSINSARGNKFFGSCADADQCTSPATEGAASDTETDSVSFLPPADVRGDIARAMFYMDVRYTASNHGGVDLALTDCPTSDGSTMAFLSQLFEWHEEDPVSDEEMDRNTKVCEWQGNRNPFVDFPFLISDMFGSPSSRPYVCNVTKEPVATTSVSPTPTDPSVPSSPAMPSLDSTPTVAPVASSSYDNNNETAATDSSLGTSGGFALGGQLVALVASLWMVRNLIW